MKLGEYCSKIKFNFIFDTLIIEDMTFSISLYGDQKGPKKHKPHIYGKVQKLPILGGLHHHYFRSAA